MAKLLDKIGRYALYGQMFGNDNANMTMGQRIGGAAFNAIEQATLGQMGTLGKAISAGLSARGKSDKTAGSGIDTQQIQFQQIKGDDVVGAINQSTGQLITGLNSINTTLGRGFNGLKDELQSHAQKLDEIKRYGEDTAIGVRELYEQLNKLAYDRGGKGGGVAVPVGAAGATTGGSGGGQGILETVLQGGMLAVLGKALARIAPVLSASLIPLMAGAITSFLDKDASKAGNSTIGSWINENIPGAAALDDFVFKMTGGAVGTDINDPRYSWNKNKDAQAQGKDSPTPTLQNEEDQYAYINDPGIEGQQGDLGKPGANHGVRVRLVKKVASGWIVEYPNGYQAFTGEKTISKDPPKVDQLPSTGPQSSLDIRKNIQVASITPTTMTDASSAGAEPWSENWDEEFHKKFPEWMNIKDLDYPQSRLMDSATPTRQPYRDYLEKQKSRRGLQGPDVTSEQKLKEQEAVAEEAQKEQITNDLSINAKELIYKAEKIVFDTDLLEFKYSKALQTQAQMAPSTPGGAPGGAPPATPAAPPSPTTMAGAAPSSRLPGGATPGSAAEAAGQGGVGPVSPVAPQQQQQAEQQTGPLTTIRTASGKSAQVGAAYAKNFQGFINDLEATGYQIRSLGGYANRANVNDPSKKSYHAAGAAIDINPEQNPNNSTKTDLPPQTAALAAKWGLGWGMNWKSTKDPMHFSAARGEQGSFDVARADIMAGEAQGGAAPAGGGAPMASSGGGGAPAPMPSSGGGGGMSGSGGAGNLLSSMLGGGGSPFGMASNMLGPLIGSMSKNTSLNAAAPQPSAPTTNIYNNAKQSQGMQGQGGINPGQPQPAVSSMFAKLFEGSAMFG